MHDASSRQIDRKAVMIEGCYKIISSELLQINHTHIFNKKLHFVDVVTLQL